VPSFKAFGAAHFPCIENELPLCNQLQIGCGTPFGFVDNLPDYPSLIVLRAGRFLVYTFPLKEMPFLPPPPACHTSFGMWFIPKAADLPHVLESGGRRAEKSGHNTVLLLLSTSDRSPLTEITLGLSDGSKEPKGTKLTPRPGLEQFFPPPLQIGYVLRDWF